MDALEWIGLVWNYCYSFLTETVFQGYSLWYIMFSVWLVGTLIVGFRLGVVKKK